MKKEWAAVRASTRTIGKVCEYIARETLKDSTKRIKIAQVYERAVQEFLAKEGL